MSDLSIEHVEELRILARDGGRLDARDKAVLASAADLLEMAEATASIAITKIENLTARCNALQEIAIDRSKMYSPYGYQGRVTAQWGFNVR